MLSMREPMDAWNQGAVEPRTNVVFRALLFEGSHLPRRIDFTYLKDALIFVDHVGRQKCLKIGGR